MWKGVISFGLVSIPVRLYVATEPHSVSFRQLCGEHLSPIRYKRWCEAGDHEVPFSDIKKGYEVSTGNYVVLEDSDLEKLPLPTTHTVEIFEFVRMHDIQAGLYFKAAYYIEPERGGIKPYYLLQRALAETDMTAMARVTFRDREHLCALQPLAGQLLMITLHWHDEIRSELKDLAAEAQINPRELQMAKSLVQSLAAESFEPNRYRDRYHEALMQVINAKLEGADVISAPEAATQIKDLMEALKASVIEAKKQRAAERAGARAARRKSV